jgi:hypothetical protein
MKGCYELTSLSQLFLPTLGLVAGAYLLPLCLLASSVELLVTAVSACTVSTAA